MKDHSTTIRNARETGISSTVHITIARYSCFSRSGFTLLELLIVIGLLAALVGLVLPQFGGTRAEARDQMRVAEMHAIHEAFLRFYGDVMPTDVQLTSLTNWHFAPLLARTNAAYAYQEWDPIRNRGWRGPYMHTEGIWTNAAGHVLPGLFDPAGALYRIAQTNAADPRSLVITLEGRSDLDRRLLP